MIANGCTERTTHLEELQPPVLHERSARLHVVRQQLRELPEDVLLYLHRAVSQQRLQRLFRAENEKKMQRESAESRMGDKNTGLIFRDVRDGRYPPPLKSNSLPAARDMVWIEAVAFRGDICGFNIDSGCCSIYGNDFLLARLMFLR